jgi:hypothetical protein
MTTVEQLFLPWRLMYEKRPSFVGSCPVPLILWTVSLNAAVTVPPIWFALCPGSRWFHAVWRNAQPIGTLHSISDSRR